MTRYETLLLTIPEITADEASALESNFEKTLNAHKARLISFERWGKYRLAYPVRKHDYGVYFLTRFELPEQELNKLIGEINALLSVKYNEIVMRQVTCYLSPNAPLSYHRPESLEETPSRDVETFLKESKMSGLLSSREEKTGPTRRGVSEGEEESDILDEAEGA
jgi:small subunit ribosomal protein S6